MSKWIWWLSGVRQFPTFSPNLNIYNSTVKRFFYQNNNSETSTSVDSLFGFISFVAVEPQKYENATPMLVKALTSVVSQWHGENTLGN